MARDLKLLRTACYVGLVELLLCAAVTAQTTCTAGRVSLASIAASTYVFGDQAYTVNYCTPGAATSSSLASCGATGYVQDHFVGNGTCRANYATIVSGLTAYSTGSESGVFFVVSANGATASITANVTVVCDAAGSSSSASLIGVSDVFDGTNRRLQLRLSSYSGCQVSNFFCSDSLSCSSTSKTCVNGVCFQKSCATLTESIYSSASNSAFAGQFSVADCNGTPLANLTSSDFVVALNGVDTDGSVYRNEVPIAFGAAPQATPAITTLLLDQSASVTSGSAQSVLQAAARTYVETVALSNTNHFVSVIAFDGGAEPVVVLPYTNDAAAVIAAIDGSLPPSSQTDARSTNLYGAVISGVRTANAMRFTFGPANASVVSSMIVFTDGYDTSGRETRAAAVAAATQFASSVNIISIGVSETSDTSFLTDIATSGIYSFPTTSALVSSFTEVAQQVANAANSVYTAALCVPIRASTVVVSVRMNASLGYSTSSIAEFTVNASTFTGGCSQATVNSLAVSGASANTTVDGQSTSIDTLTFDSTTTKTLAVSGAYFFQATVPTGTASVLRVTPDTLTARFLTSQRCLLSPYCFDGIFNGTTTVTAGVTYRVAVENGPTEATTITVFFGPAVAVTTPSPTTTTSPTTPSSTVAGGTTSRGSLDGNGLLSIPYNVSEVRAGDVDEAATYVFLGYGIAMVAVLLVGVLASVMFGSTTTAKNVSLHRSAAQFRREQTYTVAPVYSGDSMAYAHTPSFAAHDRGNSVHESLLMSPQPPPLASGVSPYRGQPYAHSSPALSFGRAFDASARWSPQRDFRDL